MSTDLPNGLAPRIEYPIWHENIPAEMRAHNSWCNWRYDAGKKPPLRSLDGRPLSVTDPRDWSTFDDAMRAAFTNNVGLGYVFAGNGLSGVDIDGYTGNAEQQRILESLDSYTEISPSGGGLHVIVRAVLPGQGKHPHGLGLFDRQRFFCCTGQIYHHAAPIAYRQDAITALWHSLNPGHTQSPTVISYISQPERMSDDQIIVAAGKARHGATFRALWAGHWRSLNWYRSQSEADMALVEWLTYYSRNFVQSKRLFIRSGMYRPISHHGVKYIDDMVRKGLQKHPTTYHSGGMSSGWQSDATCR
jgi:putative DNA primase/helicase